ncbi:hypothetical protein RAS1_22980 [Phycisphaerae bacterium RAS1]|nr:hypothetical protein RAS1_22980 [Phycisphaerae bacterium RAS1]
MNGSNRKGILIGLILGVATTGFVGTLMAQQAAQPVKSETQYFVTGEGDDAHLWVREGTNLRCVGHGECKTHGDHKDHDHGKEKPKP